MKSKLKNFILFITELPVYLWVILLVIYSTVILLPIYYLFNNELNTGNRDAIKGLLALLKRK